MVSNNFYMSFPNKLEGRINSYENWTKWFEITSSSTPRYNMNLDKSSREEEVREHDSFNSHVRHRN